MKWKNETRNGDVTGSEAIAGRFRLAVHQDNKRRCFVKIIKENREDMPGFTYRFVGISKIKSNTYRRLALILTMPVFFSFNCLAVVPLIVISCILNNILLFETLMKRWNHPVGGKNER